MLLPPFHSIDKIFSNLSKELVFPSLRNFPTIIHRCSNESSDFRCFARPGVALWKNRGREAKLKGKKLHFLSTSLSLFLFEREGKFTDRSISSRKETIEIILREWKTRISPIHGRGILLSLLFVSNTFRPILWVEEQVRDVSRPSK